MIPNWEYDDPRRAAENYQLLIWFLRREMASDQNETQGIIDNLRSQIRAHERAKDEHMKVCKGVRG